MAGLMSRMSTVMKAKMSRMLDKAEDPNETLDYSYQKQLEMLQKVKQGIATVVTSKKRLQLQTAKLEQSIVTLEGQARTALGAGREDLARTALERKALVQSQLQGLDSQIAELEAEQQRLIENERRLNAKVETFRTRKEVIKAQYTAAEATVRIGEAQTGLSEEMADVGLSIQRAEDKTEQMRARAAAVGELVDSGVLEDALSPGQSDLDRQIAQLTTSSGVDSDLEKMKAELGIGSGGGDAAALPAGSETAPVEGDAAPKEAQP
jgi:phage shock protein A